MVISPGNQHSSEAEFSTDRIKEILREDITSLDNQIIAIFKQAEAGSPAPELYYELGISSANFYK